MFTSDNETMNVLRKRIDNAEGDTKQLVEQLTKMGFPPAQVGFGQVYGQLLCVFFFFCNFPIRHV